MGLFLEKTGVCEHETQEYSPVPNAKQTLSAQFAPGAATGAPLAQHGLQAPSRKPRIPRKPRHRRDVIKLAKMSKQSVTRVTGLA
jgi:hypothetical protein